MTMLRRVVALVAVAVSLALALSAVRDLADAPVKVNPSVQLLAHETYSVSMWVSVPAMPRSELFVQAMEELVASFTATWANVTVTTTFVPAQELSDALRAALARGEPPDVLVNSAPSPSDYGALQVPLGLYLSPAEKGRLSPAIIAQLSARGELAALPLAYTFRVFAANPAVLRAAGVDIALYAQRAWSWDEFFAATAALNRQGKRGLVLTNAHFPLLRSLAASLGKPSPFGAGGGLEWGLSELQALGETARRLAPAAADEDALARFLGGQEGLIGPLNPELTRWLLSTAQKRGLTPLLLPVPFLGTSPVVDLAAVSVVLFRPSAGTATPARRQS
jgi:ABC-type glycerol-3-phosphate transport system substrate-binding protein